MRGGVFKAFVALLLVHVTSPCPKECSCDVEAKSVDCRGRGLYDIPRHLQSDTLELLLQDNRIRGLGSMAFRDTPQLRVLDLTNNSITSVSPSALLGLRVLQSLSLGHNAIRELDRRLLGSVRNLTLLDLSHNVIAGLPGAMADSMRQLRHLFLRHNRLQKLDRGHLEALESLEELQLRGNPWRCDCHMIALKLWLETFRFKGGVVDEVTCTQPDPMKDKDLQRVPYELFHSCMATSYHYLFSNLRHLESEHRHRVDLLHLPELAGGGAEAGQLPECEPKQRPRPVNLRHAIATVVVTGVVCSIVLLMMVAAAIYGCAYAAIMARYQRDLKKAEQRAAAAVSLPEKDKDKEAKGTADEKEPLENTIA
ncbi:leucine-rich repeat and transmembrane domain-containing protein 1 isoform X2 [Clupea harengus]|uniref:Leucine-rich repeat and transmembrane domain-containing protein 1 isoform X2 n=1 Tax=Clupea harengus TaxID=7950 RepID=A0A6P8FG33_CLUHA|nr:leucine-rich repeat and transmembrane domain-containing protein 1 isoform X2 [Clupea harengus]